ncbi:MAG TPA: hypothetical protein VE261_07815 [Gaiellaceae bacterium]|nr:hypothetical protein [Gaiellaceae bacterium]
MTAEAAGGRGARIAWLAFAVLVSAATLVALAEWVRALALRGPVLYGEGAVAHAALLARDGVEYVTGAAVVAGPLRPIFTAANYPPLYFRLAGLGDPFIVGRAVSIAATIAVAAAIVWRARRGGPVVALALGAGWIATFPVAVWGPAVKPDLVALALTVGGVLTIAAGPRRAFAAGILLALAVWTKPTELLPAAALLAWCITQGRRALLGYVAGGAAGLVVASIVLMGPGFPLVGGKAFLVHVVTWNALPWSAEQVGLLAFVGAATLGATIGAAILLREYEGPLLAYALGGLGVLVLGGREGATVNYLLDLSAAAALALASAAPRLRALPAYPVAATVQLALTVALLDPFALVPGGLPRTGAWGDPARLDVVRDLPAGPALVEDSGLLVGAGREPVVDDLFLWSRLEEASSGGPSFAEGPRLIEAVAARRFTTIASETDLERLDAAPAYERARWAPDLVRVVLEGYVLDHRVGALWFYRRR